MSPTGVLYAFTESGEIYVVDLGTGALSDEPVSLQPDGDPVYHWVYGADFDRNGQLWIIVEVTVGDENWAIVLASVNVSTGLTQIVDEITLASSAETYPVGITVWGAVEEKLDNQLAATGVDTGPIGFAAGAALLLGGVLLFVRNRRSIGNN